MIEKKTGIYSAADGTPIYFEVRGSGEPVIFVYGIACLMNHWHHQVSYFSKTMTAVTYDLRGHHKSNPVFDLHSLTVKKMGEDLVGLISYLGFESAHVVGHSFGAPVILEGYAQKPQAFKSLCFINGFAKNPVKGMFGLDVIEPLFFYIKSTYEKNPDLWNTLWRYAVDNPLSMRLAGLAGGFNLHLTHFKDIEVYARGVAHIDLAAFLIMFEELLHFNGEQILSQIEVPTLVISGENDNVTPKKFQEDFRNLIPHCEFLSVPYGSHCTQLDFPDLINLKIKDFWSEIK